MARRLTNPDGSYFDAPDDDPVLEGSDHDDGELGWYQDVSGWWRNADPERAWDPRPADAG